MNTRVESRADVPLAARLAAWSAWWPALELRARWPGVAAAAALALAASWMAGGLGDPLARNPVLVAMLFGLLLGSVLGCPAVLQPGLAFTKRQLLRLGVMLLGFRITVLLLVSLGLVPILIAAVELVVVLLLVRWAGRRWFGLDPALALLVAVGSSVCGAAAILSVAALAPGREKHAGLAISLITVSGTVALLLYPIAFTAGWLPGLDEHGFGVTVGASIFELAQVYGASFAISEGALNTATLVKLSKVVMLIPLLLVMGLQRLPGTGSEGEQAGAARPRVAVPWFVVGFLVVLLLNSSITLHPQVRASLLQFDQFLFLMVMIALGLSTPLRLPRQPAQALRLAGLCALALALSAGLAYAMVRLSGSGAELPSDAADRAGAELGLARRLDAGGRVFDAVGCAKCHVPSLPGIHGDVPLYSDLLLHDMGPALDDKIVQGEATGADWRTTPLVGLHMRQRYLHDGRAETLRDAVLAHGGEAEIVRQRFFELDEAEQQAVYRFLSGL
ncbi:putative sulfate exporter family transporter [Ideonella azotifigens]|uniref:Cytochrome c domain-containing protein n=1 Tax=Ideonella azotifigens TaxID=513160 RepID=A0ABN1KG88_9BURK|nr:putative sulfate exporter family transporter [Ideonella azotifigens]MCD2340429.1 putative sulfate exporter family transporter [Ideonella azotifigens]